MGGATDKTPANNKKTSKTANVIFLCILNQNKRLKCRIVFKI